MIGRPYSVRHRNLAVESDRIFSLTVGEPRAGVPEVVCVHGLGVSGRYFLPTMRALAPYTRVSAPDLPGFGRSSNPKTVYDIPTLARVLGNWIDGQGFEQPPVVVANSMGCQVAAALVSERPALARGLVLIGPTMDANNRTARSQVVRLLHAAPFERLDLLGLVAYEYLRCGPRRLVGSLRHALRDPLESRISSLQVPTLIVRGGRDVIAPSDWVAQLGQLLPAGTGVTLTETGHAVNFSASDRLVPLILPMLKN